MFVKSANKKNSLSRDFGRSQKELNEPAIKGAMSSNPYGKVYCMDGGDKDAARAAIEKVSKAYR